ncbi:YncE family protein [Kitasatospora aureofaciens]|uniref:YncE family protein n=1 Tax=Kitasatospora aureofaciens TaxID=1894 RepID=UPI00380ECECD
MNSLIPKARWSAALLTATVLLGTAAGVAEAAPTDGPGPFPARSAPSAPSTATAETPNTPVTGVDRLINLPGANWAQRALVSADGTRTYVGEETGTGSKLDVIDTQSGALLAQVPTSTDFWSGAKAFSPDGTRIYLITKDTLNVFDTTANTLSASIPLPDQPRPDGWQAGSPTGLAVSPDGSKVYLGETGPNSNVIPNPSFLPGRLLTFSTAQNAFTDTADLPTVAPKGIVVRPNGTDAYVSSAEGLIHLNVAAHPSVVRTLTAPGFVDELLLTPDGTRVYALTRPDGRVQVVDLATDTLTATIDLNTGIRQIPDFALSPDGTRLYVLEDTQLPGPTVVAYDTATNQPVPAENVAQFGLEHGAGLTVGPDGHTFYVTGVSITESPGTYLQIVSY